MAAIDEATRPMPSARRSQLSDDDDDNDAVKAVQRTLNQTTSGIFIDTGKKVALTTQRKIPMPKIFRTKSSDSNTNGGFPVADPSTAKWACAQCRYENVEDGNHVCCLCGSSRSESTAVSIRTTNSMAHAPPAQISSPVVALLPAQIPSPVEVPILPMNPFDAIIDNQANPALTNTNEAPKIRQRHSFDDSWFTQAPVVRSRVNSTDSHSLPDEITPTEPRKPPRRRNKSTEQNPLPMFQSPDYLPPLQVTTRLNGNGGPTSSMSKPTRTGKDGTASFCDPYPIPLSHNISFSFLSRK